MRMLFAKVYARTIQVAWLPTKMFLEVMSMIHCQSPDSKKSAVLCNPVQAPFNHHELEKMQRIRSGTHLSYCRFVANSSVLGFLGEIVRRVASTPDRDTFEK